MNNKEECSGTSFAEFHSITFSFVRKSTSKKKCTMNNKPAVFYYFQPVYSDPYLLPHKRRTKHLLIGAQSQAPIVKFPDRESVLGELL